MATKIKKEKETALDRQIKKHTPFLTWLAVLAIVFIVFYYVFQGTNKINYQGLSFTKEKFGSLIFYGYNFFVEGADGRALQRTLYLRIDPRHNDIPVTANITYPAGKFVYISINSTGLNKCNDSMIAVGSLSAFLTYNNLRVRGGTPDIEEAKANNQSHITCDSHPDSTTIAIWAGNETKLFQKNSTSLCYNLEVSNCEILAVTEKFMIRSIIDSRE